MKVGVSDGIREWNKNRQGQSYAGVWEVWRRCQEYRVWCKEYGDAFNRSPSSAGHLLNKIYCGGIGCNCNTRMLQRLCVCNFMGSCNRRNLPI